MSIGKHEAQSLDINKIIKKLVDVHKFAKLF